MAARPSTPASGRDNPAIPRGGPNAKTQRSSGSPLARYLILKEAERLVTIREGDETRQMPAIEVVTTRPDEVGRQWQRLCPEAHDRAVHSGPTVNGGSKSGNQTHSGGSTSPDYREQIAEAERKGEPPPAPLPHPDDVVIDDEKGVRFIGPVDDAGVARLKETIKVRDTLIMQDALDNRLADNPEGADQPGTALLFAIILDNGVPARFRLAEADWIERMMRYDTMPKRELLRAVYRAWKELGRRVPRGRTLPPLRWGEQTAATVLDMASDIQSGDDNVTDHVNGLNALLKEGTGRKATT